MNDKERLQLEEELLMTCSKAQAINKYIDELEESSKLSELWCKSQQENARLKDKVEKIIEYINHYETIRGYYEYEECGYDEYNYEEDLKEELLEMLK